MNGFAEFDVDPGWQRAHLAVPEIAPAERDAQPATLRYRVSSVDGEVHHQLLEVRGRHRHGGQVGVEAVLEDDASADHPLEQLSLALELGAEIQARAGDHLLAAEREELTRELGRRLRRLHHRCKKRAPVAAPAEFVAGRDSVVAPLGDAPAAAGLVERESVAQTQVGDGEHGRSGSEREPDPERVPFAPAEQERALDPQPSTARDDRHLHPPVLCLGLAPASQAPSLDHAAAIGTA
ncbi:MAG: hypothetical protein JW751_03520 [Polyangiaceae bacterium]|nr:hypothetical protein [Polyangiaceae bacterium]